MIDSNDRTITDGELEAVDSKGRTLLANAVEQSDPETALWLLREAADTEAVYCSDVTGCELPLLFQSILIHIIRNQPESLEIATLLIRYGASPTHENGKYVPESVIDILRDNKRDDLITALGLANL